MPFLPTRCTAHRFHCDLYDPTGWQSSLAEGHRSIHSSRPRKVQVRLPGKGNSNSDDAMPVHLIITTIKRIRTSRLSKKNSHSSSRPLCFSGENALLLLVSSIFFSNFRRYGFRVQGLGFGLVGNSDSCGRRWALGFRVQVLEFGVWGLLDLGATLISLRCHTFFALRLGFGV